MENQRIATHLSSVVDDAILLFESGLIDAAYHLLLDNDFSLDTIQRIFCYPEQRRRYINDMVTGFWVFPQVW